MAFTVRAEAIVPKALDIQKVRAAVQGVLDDEGKRDKTTLDKTISGWSEAPSMAYETGMSSKEAWVWIGPSGSEDMVEKWRRIDEGLEEHPIDSQTTMVFPWQGRGVSYDAKTTPRQFSSKSAWTKKGPTRRTKHIKAHYITPREWSKTLAEQRIGPFAADIQAAINRALS